MIGASIAGLVIASPIAYALARREKHAAAGLTVAILTIPALITALLAVVNMYSESTPMLILNKYNGVYLLTISVVGLAVAVYGIRYMQHRAEELKTSLGAYYATLPLFVAGMLGVVVAKHVILLIIFLEVAVLSSLVPVLLYGYGDRRKIAIMYFVWSHAATMLMLAGFLLAAQETGSFTPPLYGGPRDISTLALMLIVIGAAIKMALLGVHIWLPYVHAEAPTPISALLSPALIGLGGYVIAIYEPALAQHRAILDALLIYGVITAIYGAAAAYSQSDIKRLLAYSSVSQMGYMAFAIGTGTQQGLSAAALIYLAHGLGKAILFMAAGYMILYLGTRSIHEYRGLYANHVAFSATLIVGFMNLVGILTIGMIAEMVMAYALALRGFGLKLAIAFIAMLSGTAVYAFNTIRLLVYGEPNAPSAKPHTSVLGPMAVLATLSIILMIPPISAVIYPTLA